MKAQERLDQYMNGLISITEFFYYILEYSPQQEKELRLVLSGVPMPIANALVYGLSPEGQWRDLEVEQIMLCFREKT